MSELKEYQNQIKQFVIDKGFDKETVPEVFMLFLEEAGEFAKAARQKSTVKNSSHSKTRDLESEAADVFWLLVDLCNRLDIDLEKAYLNKKEINDKRTWS